MILRMNVFCRAVKNSFLTRFSYKLVSMGAVTSKKREYRINGGEPVSDSPIEKVLCSKDEVKDGEMKEFQVGQAKVLLVNQNGKYSALGSKCTHYGAPLATGVMKDGIIRCPWHGACFNATTGDIEDFPGLDSLACFETIIENEQVKIKALQSALEKPKRQKPVAKYCSLNPKTFVIVGGGAAGQVCIETLRQNGFDGKLILVTKEKHYPYDRPKLSKALDAEPKTIYLRDQDYYHNADVTVMHETEVTSLDTEQRQISCDNGKLIIKYDSVMFATGGIPVKPDIPGVDLQNVCILRTPDDANYIAKNAVNKDVVIMGSSFIGMEVASYLTSKARSINVISRSEVPFKFIFGAEIGNSIKDMFVNKGVIFHANSSIVKFEGKNGHVTNVILESGDSLPADICIIGIGVKPATDIFKDTSISLNSKGLISVNKYMETSVRDVYACGDIVEFPLSVFDDEIANVCHWQMASAHGRVAGLNMLGKKQGLHSVPFFWCAMAGRNFRYAGYGDGYDDIIIKGELDGKFIAYFCKANRVVAICTSGRDPVAADFASDLVSGKCLLKDNLKD